MLQTNTKVSELHYALIHFAQNILVCTMIQTFFAWVEEFNTSNSAQSIIRPVLARSSCAMACRASSRLPARQRSQPSCAKRRAQARAISDVAPSMSICGMGTPEWKFDRSNSSTAILKTILRLQSPQACLFWVRNIHGILSFLLF